jgi:hypothetical protein
MGGGSSEAQTTIIVTTVEEQNCVITRNRLKVKKNVLLKDNKVTKYAECKGSFHVP